MNKILYNNDTKFIKHLKQRALTLGKQYNNSKKENNKVKCFKITEQIKEINSTILNLYKR